MAEMARLCIGMTLDDGDAFAHRGGTSWIQESACWREDRLRSAGNCVNVPLAGKGWARRLTRLS